MKTNSGDAAQQVARPDNALEGVEADAAPELVALRWSFNDQLDFGDAAVSAELITAAQRDIAVQHSMVTGVPIGHSLIYIGATTQRQLLLFLEKL